MGLRLGSLGYLLYLGWVDEARLAGVVQLTGFHQGYFTFLQFFAFVVDPMVASFAHHRLGSAFPVTDHA